MTEFRKFSAALDDAKLTLQTAAATDNSDSATARREAAEAIRRRCADGDLRRTADKFAAKLEATDDVTEPTFLATLQTARRVRDAAAARASAFSSWRRTDDDHVPWATFFCVFASFFGAASACGAFSDVVLGGAGGLTAGVAAAAFCAWFLDHRPAHRVFCC